MAFNLILPTIIYHYIRISDKIKGRIVHASFNFSLLMITGAFHARQKSYLAFPFRRTSSTSQEDAVELEEQR